MKIWRTSIAKSYKYGQKFCRPEVTETERSFAGLELQRGGEVCRPEVTEEEREVWSGFSQWVNAGFG